MKIKKEITETGEINITFIVDGEEREQHFSLSRELTGTTCENGNGIFESWEEISFSFGEYKKMFELPPLNQNDSVEKIARVIQERIDTVSAWVAECKSKAAITTAEILTTEQMVERLQEENRLLYRNRQGQITTLDI